MPRTVQLSDDAYATLAALKQPGDSFSDTVLRLARSRKDPLALARLSARARLDLGAAREKFVKGDIERLRRLGMMPKDK